MGSIRIGGLVGTSSSFVEVTDSFWDIETSEQVSSDGGMGKTTAEMQMKSTFLKAGWDFVNETANSTDDIWKIFEGLDYPRLWWEPYKYSGGSGEPNDPYQIATAEDLILLGDSPEDYDKHFILIANVDLDPNLSGRKIFDKAVIGPAGSPFTGVFDGNDKKISNFNYSSTETDYIGIFGYVEGAEIKDLGLIDPNIDALERDYVGSLIGNLEGGTISDCYVEGGNVVGDENVGGLVGALDNGTITDCYSSADVSGTGRITGGLVGYGQGGEITNCYTNCNVAGGDFVGGLAGLIQGSIPSPWHPRLRIILSIIANCYSIGDISGNERVGGLVGDNGGGTITSSFQTGSVNGIQAVGGLVGNNEQNGTLINCYNTGAVNGYFKAGGLVGFNFSGDVTQCYSTGTVSDRNPWSVGALVGENEKGDLTGCFWDTQTSGLTRMCGWQAGNATGCDNSYGKTTAEMQSAKTFFEAGWDFVDETANGTEDIWWIDEGQGYPRLWWEPLN
jgi:hypothetical protein